MIDETVLTWIVEWDPGPRLDPLLAAAILFGPRASCSRRPRRSRSGSPRSSLERLGRTAGRLFSISTAGSIFGTFVTAFWLVPGSARIRCSRRRGDARGGGARRRARGAARPPPLVLAGRAVGREPSALAVSLAPEQGGSSAASRPRTGRRSTAARGATPGPLDPASVGALGEQFTVRAARDTRYHRMVVADDSDSRYLRFDSSFQSGMWLGRSVPHAVPVHRLPHPRHSPIGPAAPDVLFIGLGGGSAPKRMWRDFPRPPAPGRRARSRRRRRRLPLVRVAARPSSARWTSTTAAAGSRATRSAGT